ncbi:hypothetical protein GN244_ATG07842 [Phytophthora infestans]|uniref:Uncharacterized protein n=1 Tax=Phytophthora infestans TaxID=4787 RepID=A0A833TFK0_PHYIN|nr:hypothetical protein GN244_ATG07842 [Phytophthora infestans]
MGRERAMYVHEGSEVLAQLRDHLPMLLELQNMSPEGKIEEAIVGGLEATTQEMDKRNRVTLSYHRTTFLGYDNAAPGLTQEVVYDLDVDVP